MILDQYGAIEKVKSYTEVLKKYFDINAVFPMALMPPESSVSTVI
jgi:hypothetical protein